MARLRVTKPNEDKRKTKPLQIKECSIVMEKIPAGAKTFKEIKIMNSDAIKPDTMKIVKEVEKKVTRNKKQNPAVMVQVKTTEIAKKDETNKPKESSGTSQKNESTHVLRNRIVKTVQKTKTPVPLANSSTQNGVSRKRTKMSDSVEKPSVVPEPNAVKKSKRIAEKRSKSVVAEKNVPVKSRGNKSTDVPKKVAVTPVQLQAKNVQKNNESIQSTPKLLKRAKRFDKNEDKSKEKEIVKDARNEELTIEEPIKKKQVYIEIDFKQLEPKKKLKSKKIEVFSSSSEPEDNIMKPKTKVKSKIKIPLPKKTVQNSSNNNKQLSPNSPTYRLKMLQVENENNSDDIYDFPMSQSMVDNSKVSTVNKVGIKKKRIRHTGKAGSKLELLMKKSTMNVIGNSCHVQNNPDLYKMKQIEMNKMILAQKTRANSPKPFLPKVKQSQSYLENISDEDDVIASTSTSSVVDTPKVVASPPFKTPVNKKFSGLQMTNPNTSSSPFRINDEILFPRTFYMQLGPDTVPSYSSDCIHPIDRRTFNVSSELRSSLENKIPEIYLPNAVNTETEEENDENEAETDENLTENDENRPVVHISTTIPIKNSCVSFLGDSNAENVEPIGHKSPTKAKKHVTALRSPLKSFRSPLKSLAIPSQSEFGVSSPLVIFNLTAQQLTSPKKIESFMTQITRLKSPEKQVDELDESTESLAIVDDSGDSDQDEPQPSTSKQSVHLKHLNFDKKIEEVQNELGFDELLEESRTGFKPTSSPNNNENEQEITNRLQNLKKYLPSRQNKERDKEIFATSPVKKNKNLFKSPIIDKLTDIRTAFHASTPVNEFKKKELMRNIFMNTSKIETQAVLVESEVSIDQQDDSVTTLSNTEVAGTINEEQVDENFVSLNLFNDQSEVFLNNTKSYQRKRKFEFLNAPEDQDDNIDDQYEQLQLKRQTKSKKKKPNVENSREFKDFVLNKSKEFAEVDEYKLVVEKGNKP
ncbi:unnamed protein product [Diamesa serratosioi]